MANEVDEGDERTMHDDIPQASTSGSSTLRDLDVGGASTAAGSSALDPDEHEHHFEREEQGQPASISVSTMSSARARGTLGTAGRPPHHRKALSAIRQFLRRESCFDILPESFRLIVFDNKLTIKKALMALQTNGVVSAPLYDSSNYRFAGMFTMVDIIHLIQYYYLTAQGYETASGEVENVDLSMLRDIEVAIDVPPPPIVSVHPDDQLFTACSALVRTHARRLPLIDRDEQTGKDTIVSVLTQYRLLKFLAINCREECSRLTESIGTLGIGTYISSFSPTGEPVDRRPLSHTPSTRRQRSRSINPTPRQSSTPVGSSGVSPDDGELAERPHHENGNPFSASVSSRLENPASSAESPPQSSGGTSTIERDRFHPLATATLQTTVFDVVHLFSDLGISAVPIVDPKTGQVINLYEAVDVVDLVRADKYTNLDYTIEEALSKRARDFPGVVTCTPEDSLASILAYVREKRAHRFVIVEGDPPPPTADGVPAPESREPRVPGRLLGVLCLSDILKYFVGSGSLSGVKVVGLGMAGESGDGHSFPRVIDDDELDEINEGVSGLGLDIP